MATRDIIYPDYLQEEKKHLPKLLLKNVNQERLFWTVEKLNLKKDMKLLSIGYGSGHLLYYIAGELSKSNGLVVGLDNSEIMFRHASVINKSYVKQKTVKLLTGGVRQLDYPENYFDHIFTQNIHFFWNNPVRDISQMKPLLKENGRLSLIFQPRWARNQPAIDATISRMKSVMDRAGFTHIEIDRKDMEPVPCLSICGIKK